MTNQTQNLSQNLRQNKNQEKSKNFWQKLKMWQKIGTIIFVLILIYIIIIPLFFCTNIDFDFSKNSDYISCSQNSDCIAKTCGCLNEKGAKKFSFWTAFCVRGLKCTIPSSCSCQDRKCVGRYDYGNDILEDVSLITDKIEYQTGEEVKLTVGNNLPRDIYGAFEIEIYRNNNWTILAKDIYYNCDIYERISKAPLSNKANQTKKYIWDQKTGCLNEELPLNEKLRFKIILFKDSINMQNKNYYSNEFTIGEIQEVSLIIDKIESVFNSFLLAEKNCDIELANSVLTEKSKEVMHYTCSNMSAEYECYKSITDDDFEIYAKSDKAILHFNSFSNKEGWPFFFAKEDGDWKIDFHKMAFGITMGGSGCATGWGWRNEEIVEEFCGFFEDGECPEKR